MNIEAERTDWSRAESRRRLGAETLAFLEADIARLPPPPPELVERVRRLLAAPVARLMEIKYPDAA